MKKEQTECNRCGKCCEEGGPAFHIEDLPLISGGQIPLNALVTLRFGELAHNPLTDKVQPISAELVKIRGVGPTWRCLYLDEKSQGCSIYDFRPRACRALECWQPEESLALIEKDVIGRREILADDQSLLDLVKEYDSNCPCPDMKKIEQTLKDDRAAGLARLEKLVTDDLMTRQKYIAAHKLDLGLEMFLFGRPVFQLLEPFGVRIRQQGNGFQLY